MSTLVNYEMWRRIIGVHTGSCIVTKDAVEKLCDRFIRLWEDRKTYPECNQDIADAQIKAYTFIKDVLTTDKKIKTGDSKDRYYWTKKGSVKEKETINLRTIVQRLLRRFLK